LAIVEQPVQVFVLQERGILHVQGLEDVQHVVTEDSKVVPAGTVLLGEPIMAAFIPGVFLLVLSCFYKSVIAEKRKKEVREMA
jgi:hypothetical protein